MQCAACNEIYPAALDACPQCRKPKPTQTASPEPARPGAPRRTEPNKQLGLVPTPDEQEMNPIVAAALRRIERARRESPPLARQGSGRGHAATAAARVVEEQAEQFAEQAPAQHVKRNENSGAQAKRAAQRAERIDAEGTPARPSTLAVVPPKQSPKSEPAIVEETSAAAEAKSSAHVAAPAEVEKKTSPSVETTTHVAAQSHSQPVATQAQTQSASRQPRHISGVIDDFYLERQGLDPLPKVVKPEVSYDDRAPRVRRLAAAFADLLVVAFLCAPFAAAIELTIGDWGDPRVFGSM